MIPISLCLTTYNRFDLLLDSFKLVVKDERIGEIIICDDASDEDIYEDLKRAVKWIPKVNLFRNRTNKDCYLNKREAISRASNDYVIILDSDNQIDVDYLDKIYAEKWSPDLILAPSFAKPLFDYRAFNGLTIDRHNVAGLMKEKMFSTALNTFNFFINKNEYLKVFDESVDPVTADSIYFNYCWLNAGNRIKIIEGLEYQHLVHDGSHYKINNHRTGNFYNKVEKKILDLR